ncbi:MAG TPA: hypothetical protein VHA12_01865 [Candidatus Nanoarchaeia archaeon]|nr:hypothetical protein [Candidatus Nanoarchaeia archaeon]
MQTKFKRHQEVVLKAIPNPDYIEYHDGFEDSKINIGMKGKINILLPNGQYHVEVLNKKNEIIAYVLMPEEDLESI